MFFHDWVPYDERANYLLDADLAVSTHFDHVETQFSFRTRVLDYFWAGLPVVTTAGDALSDAVIERGAGAAVPARDAEGLADALDRLLSDGALRQAAGEASARLGAEYRWERVLEPLVAFCEHPTRSPDLLDPAIARAVGRGHDLSVLAAGHSIKAVVGHVRRREWATLRSKAALRVTRKG